MLKQCVQHIMKVKVFLQLTLLLLILSNATPVTAKVTTDSDDGEARTTAQKEPHEKQNKHHQSKQSDKPNIVIILIDDMGFNDVSFHGSNQILTPNMDALAYNGIILKRHYVPNLCTPSRATLLTGKFPIHTGMQHYVVVNDEPWGLPLREHLMPEVFRDAGYSTNLVGKWHLGFWRKEMTPTMRGFDHHYGYYSGYIDYLDHTHHMLDRNYSSGVDFRRDLKHWHEANGTYATELFTQEAERIIEQHNAEKPLFLLMSHLAVHTGNEDNPMQALQEEVDKFMHISDPKRRIYAGMISSLDQSVGRTMRALADKGILNNTIVLMYSDNGAPTVGMHSNSGSNFPFRGQKESPWEGGLRSAGAIWSPLLKQKSYVSDQVIHAIDWLPTLASAAGIRLPAKFSRSLDGIDVWDMLSNKRPTKPRSLLHSLDDIFWYSSYMNGTLKYVNGTSWDAKYDGWLGDIPMEAEADPTSAYYVQHVLSSAVHEVLGDKSLSNAQVEQLRTQATVRCPANTEDPNQPKYICEPLKAPCLFDIEQDPCERYNLAEREPMQLERLQMEVENLRLSAVPSARVNYSDPLSDPARFNGNWQWWYGTGSNSGMRPCAPSKYPIVSLLLSSFALWFVSVIF